MNIRDNWTIGDMRQAYTKHLGDENIGKYQLRFFFGGKELQKDEDLIAEYGIQNDLVIQVTKKLRE